MLPGTPGAASLPAPPDIRGFTELAGGQPCCGPVLAAAVTEALLRAGDGRSVLQRGVFQEKGKGMFFSQPVNEACSAAAAPDRILNF